MCRLGLAATRVQDQYIAHRAVHRRGHANLKAEIDHAAREPADLERSAALQIMVHGRGHFRGPAVEERNPLLGIIRGQSHAMRTADGDHFPREIEQEFSAHRGSLHYRPVTIVDAGAKKTLKLTIEVPVEDMAKLTTADDIPSGPASVGDTRPSIWSAIHPRLLELIQSHRSTLIFVNSRRLAERLAGALNELAGETLVRSHHGSIARPHRPRSASDPPRRPETEP